MKLAYTAALATLLPVTAALADDVITDQRISIDFSAEIGGQAFSCSETYSGLGSTDAEVHAVDYRLYLSNVEAIATDGTRVPVKLDESEWQHAGVALLDFEDGSASCANGTTPTNTRLSGEVAEGEYTGVAFKIGVPFELNHGDPTVAPSPLNLTSMFWNWRGGYKFIRIDMVPTDKAENGPKGWFLHLGSTMCAAESKTSAPARPCKAPNLMEVVLEGFDPAAQTVIIDPAAVVAEADLRANAPETSPGCMSFPGDPDCTTVMAKLGLPYVDIAAGEQLLFKAR